MHPPADDRLSHATTCFKVCDAARFFLSITAILNWLQHENRATEIQVSGAEDMIVSISPHRRPKEGYVTSSGEASSSQWSQVDTSSTIALVS